MGLDITAYSRLKKINKSFDDYDRDWTSGKNECYLFNTNKEWTNHPPVTEGCFEYEKDFRFRAGSYSGYNTWRNQLCLMAHDISADDFWKKDEVGAAFYYLISFSDCEGTLSAQAAGALFMDFVKFRAKAVEFAETLDPYNKKHFIELYDDWMNACGLAMEDGAIDFH